MSYAAPWNTPKPKATVEVLKPATEYIPEPIVVTEAPVVEAPVVEAKPVKKAAVKKAEPVVEAAPEVVEEPATLEE